MTDAPTEPPTDPPADGDGWDLIDDDSMPADYLAVYSNRPTTWTAALDAAAATVNADGLSGHLVTITSQEEMDVVLAAVASTKGFKPMCWIGASDRMHPGIFSWVTGEDFSYSNWHGQHPNSVLGWGDTAYAVVRTTTFSGIAG